MASLWTDLKSTLSRSTQANQFIWLLPQQLLLPGVDQPRKEINRFCVDKVAAAVFDDADVDTAVDRRFCAVGGGLAEDVQDEVDDGGWNQPESGLYYHGKDDESKVL